MTNKNEKLAIYRDKAGEIQLDVSIRDDSVWLTQKQMGILFGKSGPTVNEHIRNIFVEGELNEDSVIRNFRITATDGKIYNTKHYNLDVVISVGYRVKSIQGTQFRIWANKVLKQYLLQGYVVDQKLLLDSQNKLQELKDAVHFLSKGAKTQDLLGQEQELFSVLEYYSSSISILGKYDANKLRAAKGTTPIFELTYESAIEIVGSLRRNLLTTNEASSLFGSEIENKFKSVMGSIYQTFDGADLYSSIETKAANLLYLVAKDHAFSDGNKRIASILFVYFLEKNKYLYRKNGERKINDNTLVALAILTASSEPQEKDILIRLITNLLRN
jgi:prophage maintenance system killer protein